MSNSSTYLDISTEEQRANSLPRKAIHPPKLVVLNKNSGCVDTAGTVRTIGTVAGVATCRRLRYVQRLSLAYGPQLQRITSRGGKS